MCQNCSHKAHFALRCGTVTAPAEDGMGEAHCECTESPWLGDTVADF